MVRNKMLLSLLFVLSSCITVGWVSDYQPKKEIKSHIIVFGVDDYKNYSSVRGLVKLGDGANVSKSKIMLPTNLGEFTLNGFIIPFFPIFRYRGIFGYEENFSIMADPGLRLDLECDGRVYRSFFDDSKKKHVFPIYDRDVNLGTIVVNDDNYRYEVPFEYKTYFLLGVY